MRVAALLFLALVHVVVAIPRPDVEQSTLDDNNGDVVAQHAVTDQDGNTQVNKETGQSTNDHPFVPSDGTDNPGDVKTVTGTFKNSSSNYTSTTDDDGNVRTSGKEDSLSGVVNGSQVNDNGNVYGDQTMNVSKTNSTIEGVNGNNDVKTSEANLTDARSKDCNGVQNYQRHYDETKTN